MATHYTHAGRRPADPFTRRRLLHRDLTEVLHRPATRNQSLRQQGLILVKAVADFIASGAPLPGELLIALDRRDDVYHGHVCANCGADPDAEGDAAQAQEATADEIEDAQCALGVLTLRGRPLVVYRTLRPLGVSIAEALRLAQGYLERRPDLREMPACDAAVQMLREADAKRQSDAARKVVA